MIQPQLLSGKKPFFNEPLYVTRPNLPDKARLFVLLDDLLKRRWLTNFGHYHSELEERLRAHLKVRHVLLCCNGTVGLFLLLRALELRGKVLTTAFTFPATVHAVTMAGLEPLLCDIDLEGYTLDIESVKRTITADTSCILGVDVFGNACDYTALESIGRSRGIPVIYDSAHAFMCRYQGTFIGNFGAAQMFSFHATKLFSTAEGGAIVTNDTGLYNRLRQLINFGIRDEESVTGVGLNGKMSEVHAIFGLIALDNIGDILAKLTTLAAVYARRLAVIPGITMQKIRPGCQSNHQYMTIQVREEEFGLSRDQLHAALKRDNVVTRKYFYPAAHNYACYAQLPFARRAVLPNTETVAARNLCLPMYAALAEADVEVICDLVSAIQARASEVASKLKKTAGNQRPREDR